MTGRAPWTLLVSDVLRAVSYNGDKRMLRVLFRNGKVYEYDDVPGDVVAGLLDPQDGSHGRYFTTVIRDHFDYRDVTR